MTMSQAQAQAMLRELGWRITSTTEYSHAVAHFQRGWNLGTRLAADGAVGPLTSAALAASHARHAKGQPDASAHFSFVEFRCHCSGLAGCERILVLRDLLASMEVLRARWYPHGLSVASGYRCPRHNAAVGGATSSQHLYGGAADISYAVGATTLTGAHLFAGIGKSASTSLVRHVDRRDVSGVNLTRGTTTHPTVWNYAS